MCLWLLLRWETRWCSAVTAFHSSCQSINPSLLAFKNLLVDFVPTVRPTPPDSYSPADVHRCLFRGVFIHIIIVENTPASSRLVLKWVRYNLCSSNLENLQRTTYRTHLFLFIFEFLSGTDMQAGSISERLASFRLSHFGNFSGRPLHRKTQVCFLFFPPVNELFFHSLCEISFCFANCKCFNCLLGEN